MIFEQYNAGSNSYKNQWDSFHGTKISEPRLWTAHATAGVERRHQLARGGAERVLERAPVEIDLGRATPSQLLRRASATRAPHIRSCSGGSRTAF